MRWNVKNLDSRGRLNADSLPAYAGEVLTRMRELERVMLGVRTSEGVEIEGLPGLPLPDGKRLLRWAYRHAYGGWADFMGLRSSGVLSSRCAKGSLADYVTREIMGY